MKLVLAEKPSAAQSIAVGVGSFQPYFVGNNGPFFVGKLGANQ